jgi:type VI protein secretion system component VasK
VQRLLRAPVLGAEGVVNGALAAQPEPGAAEDAAAAAAANGAGAQFCSAFNRFASRYPFSPGATGEARASDVDAALAPADGALAALRETVEPLAVRQGSRYVARAGVTPAPRSGFLAFFSRASELSRALYGGDGGPRVAFTLRPRSLSDEVPEVTATVNGRTRTFTRSRAQSESFVWEALDSGDARLVARVNGAEVVLAEGQGPWAAFRMFRGAAWRAAGDGRWQAVWQVPGQPAPLVMEVIFGGNVPVFDPAYLRGLTCVGRIFP